MQVIAKLEGVLTRALLLILVGLVFMEVVLRSIGYPTTWSVGIAQLLFIWLIFIGANQALRNDNHVGVDLITEMLPKKVQQYIEFVMYLIIALFLLGMIVYGSMMVYLNTGRIISGTSVGYYFITLSMPVGGLLMLMTTIQKLQVMAVGLKSKARTPKGMKVIGQELKVE